MTIYSPTAHTAFEKADRARRRARQAHDEKVEIIIALAILRARRSRSIDSITVQALRVNATPRDRAHAIAKMD